ncbi:S8 family serine peptidase [Actinoplanes awajinensis]|uniref:S8 family serine peptidase n=1 Tax=Actinoplanes awajinensis TaxID=135946 RepID=UPI000831D972|nr:S8 family serine peptidase [Actinoplanes awajinensis]
MPTSSAGRPRRLSRATAAALLPLALLAPATPAAAASRSTPGGGWSGSWLSTGTTGTTGTSLKDVRKIIGADTGAAAALTGAGVGVALLDTGVAPVAGLPAAQLVNGPDLSFESQSDDLRYLDTYGHGTHMAGIIIGNDTASGSVGIAPKAKLTSIKLGTANGAVDVSQVIAAIDWVVEHRNDDPASPIRVLNLSYGSGGNPNAWTDPLQFAVEQAWKAGIVVVAAAGNDGNGSTTLANPATDPFVLSVGATATKGTSATGDDELATFTNLASQEKQPDVLAPGESIASLRDPGSNIDNTYPSARTGTTLFRGSGTSQAAAVTSAAVALLLQARPSYTPDQVKDVLKRGTAVTGKAAALGLKQVSVNTALETVPSSASKQTWTPSNGSGNLDDARGDSRVVSNNVALSGEMTIFGPFHSANWAAYAALGKTWQGGAWMGMPMAGDGWTGTSFASKTWAPAVWAGTPWGGASSWVDPSWTGRFWSGRFWSAGSWSGRFWSSEDWSSAYWG